ncbi:predicted protein [Naegleria gruberi]|uniref:Peptidyl-prolyl cis-trans isomerase n=1 Tax=Naegleria gruberi TaxID=5762 RepID=D2VV99_NAEGR|nr:uncharacterized protein NAEGRDRAFT_52534 [Naegleria gruberi]EFC39197.1 predicted protein [Naegleria gruberi]|eukprot:XP_002671941.1 predicted protein [Naegleria gruberi strain NEG-M]
MPPQKRVKDPKEKEKKKYERLQEQVTAPQDSAFRFAVLFGCALVAFIVLLGLVFTFSGERKYKKTEEGLPYPANVEVTDKVFFDIAVGKPSKRNPPIRIVLGLFGNEQPKTVENFRSLVTHERQIGYRGSLLHRIVRGFVLQGGDITKGDGTGGVSIYGQSFDDENLSIETFKGCLAMANKGPNSNNSQFFITMASTPHLDGKHTVFGRVLRGWEFLQRLELIRVNEQYKPAVDIMIVNSGIYKEEEQAPQPQE